MVPSTCPAKIISGGQREEGLWVVHHIQGEHHQPYLLHHYRNVSIQDRQIQCRIDQNLGLQCRQRHGGTVPHYYLVNL